MNIQINRRESILILSFGLFLIIVLGLKLLVLPAYDSWVTRSAQIEALESVSREPVNTSVNTADDTVESGNTSTAIFLPKSTPEELHRYFREFVKVSGLAIESISISESDYSVPTGFSVAVIRLSASGTQAQFMRFLEEVERSGKAIAIDSMGISPSGGQGVNFDVGLAAYCIEDGNDNSLYFVPNTPKNADGFRLAQSSGMDGGIR